MKKVSVLLSGSSKLQNYIDAINGVGAEATAQYCPAVDMEYDGLVLCGGSDVDPKYYQQEINGSINIDNQRDAAEFALLKAYVEAGKPVLGICRGMQLINIYFGGSLHQHLSESNLHTSKDGVDAVHTVTAVENSLLGQWYGSSFAVNSAHHQAVDKLGDGLCATAFWNDKYIEAFRHNSLPIFAVQWHPERMSFSHRREDAVDGTAIFEHFVHMCENRLV